MSKIQLHGKRLFLVVSMCVVASVFISTCQMPPLYGQTVYDVEQLDNIRSWLNQQIINLFPQKGSLFRLYSPSPPVRCATPLIRTARQYPELLEGRNRFILYRPTDPYQTYDYYGAVEVWTYDTEDGHFRIHYTEENTFGDAVPDSDGLESTIPPYILSVAETLQTVRSTEIDTLGYLPPPPDGDAGGNSRFDCYILNTYCYGYTNIDEQNHPYIVIDNNYSSVYPNQDPEGSAIGAMRVTLAHEFFHAVQYYYDDWEDLWWEENTAVWMEDEVFDFVNDYLHYLGSPYDDLNQNGRWDAGETYYNTRGEVAGSYGREWFGWFDWPFLPLDHESSAYESAKYQEYGGAIWVKHLSEKYGPDIVRNIFINCHDAYQNALSSIRTVLIAEGSSLKSELEECKEKILTREFEESEWYPQVWHIACYNQYQVQFNSHSFLDTYHGSYKNGYPGDLDHLSAHYLRFQAPAEMGKVHFSFTRTEGTAELSCLLMLSTQDGLWERIDMPLDSSTYSGELTVQGFGNEAEYQTIVAVPINISSTQDGARFRIEATFQSGYSVSFQPGMNLFSPAEAMEEQIIDSHQFLLHYFTPDSLFSLSTFNRETEQWIKNTWIESSNPYHISDPNFSMEPGEMYLLYLNYPMEIFLGSSLNTDLPLLKQGINFCCYSPRMLGNGPDNVFEFLEGLGQKASAVRKKNNMSAKNEISYHFFQKQAGENFPIIPGETYMVEMFQDEM